MWTYKIPHRSIISDEEYGSMCVCDVSEVVSVGQQCSWRQSLRLQSFVLLLCGVWSNARSSGGPHNAFGVVFVAYGLHGQSLLCIRWSMTRLLMCSFRCVFLWVL